MLFHRARIAFPVAVAAGAMLLSCGGDDEGSDSTATSPPVQSEGKPAAPGDGEGGAKLTKLGDFDEPVYVTQPPGESADIYVVERGGTVRVVADGKVESKPFFDLGDKVETGYEEQGLLSIAFAPDYSKSGLLYAYYTAKGGDNHVVELRRSADDPLTADPTSERNLMTIEHSENVNHNGGLLLFGPDRNLYIGLGDGGGGGDPDRNGQSLETLLGKILRIDPSAQGSRPYGIPKDNPFVDRSGAKPEIFAYGLRNPWRFSFDPRNGAMLIGDVGQDHFEEVDYLPRSAQAGANLGWSAFEGPARFNDDQQAPGAVKPIFSYGRDEGCSITGGEVVRDRALTSLYGRYLYADYCVGEMHSFTPATGKTSDDRPLGLTVEGLSSFGVDNAGRVYVTSLQGPVYRIDPE